MRVLLINHFPLTGSGSGVYTLNIANSLVNLGHEVCCIYPMNEPETAEYRFKCHPVYFTPEGDEAPTADALPFNFPCFTTHPKSTNTFDAMSFNEVFSYIDAFRSAMAEEIEAFKPDIIHSGHIWVLSDLAGESKVPLVITAHGTDLMGLKTSENFRGYAYSAADTAKAIISISKKNYDEIAAALDFALPKTHLISNGYNDTVFYKDSYDRAEVLAGFGIEKPYEHVVCFAGKFAQFKGIDILLKAAASYEDGKTATVLAGDGELFDEMVALSSELGLKDVYFIHNQSHDSLRSLYNIADVSLVPSRKEPFGLVAIEAGACGAPVVGTNGGGIADILVDETGILIDEEDFEALAEAVKAILSGEKVFDHEQIAAYTKAHFSQDQFTQRLVEEVYQPALKADEKE